MSRNVEIVVSQFEAVNSRDFAAAMDAYAEDVVLIVHDRLGEMVGRAATGKQAVGEWFGDWFRQFAPDYRFEIEDARGEGDRVFLVASHRGRGRASGAPVEGETAYAYTVREDKISRVELSPIETRPSKPRGSNIRAMSQRDIETARMGYAALNDAYRSGDANDFLPIAEEMWDPDIVLHLPGGVLGGGETWRGYDGMLRFIAHQMEAFREMWIEPEEFIDVGNKLVVPVRFGGQARHTGIELEFTFVHVWTMSNGKAIRMDAFETKPEALKAVGHS